MTMRRSIADWTAAALAVAILGVGGLVVIKPAIDHWDDVYRADPFVVGTTTQKVQKRLPAINGKSTRPRVSRTTTTTTESSSSFAERLLGKSGTVLLRLGLVALVAWLAAALLQRAILGTYSLRIGPAPVRTRKAPEPASQRRVSARLRGRRHRRRPRAERRRDGAGTRRRGKPRTGDREAGRLAT